jgi:hypothetical protein
MVFVSENLKNRTFVTFMDVFMVFVSENLKNRNFVTFMSVFLDGYVSIYLMFLWSLSVRMEKQELCHFHGLLSH